MLQSFRSYGSPLVASIAPVSYATVQNLLTELSRPGPLHFWRSGFVRALSDEAIEALVDLFAADVPGFFAAFGGVVSRVDPQDTAFVHRGVQHSLLVLRMWQDSAESERNIDWGRRCYRAAEPFLKAGVYVNDLSNEGEGRVRAAHGLNYERLREVKNKYDPTNFFRLNQNIEPV